MLRLDHLVMPSPDLDNQAAFYRRLGFQVGSENRHPWGTINRIVQFDGFFLELIGVAAGAVPPAHATRSFSFGAHVGDFIARAGEGASMLVVASDDAAANSHWHRQAGIGDYEPFHFARKGRNAANEEVEVAFTLAFAHSVALPEIGFFACQQHFPEHFWSKARQEHENGVTGLSEITIVTDDPQAAVSFGRAFFGGAPHHDGEGSLVFGLANGIVRFARPASALARYGTDPVLFSGRVGHIGAVTFQCQSLAALARRLEGEELPFRWHHDRVVIPSGAAKGLVVAFEQGP